MPQNSRIAIWCQTIAVPLAVALGLIYPILQMGHPNPLNIWETTALNMA